MAVFRPDESLLHRQITSIKAQTQKRWFCIIGIDGDDQNTYDLLKRLIANDDRFRVIHFPDNVGFYKNFERLIEAVPSDVDWVALSDQDDDWFPTKLEMLLPILSRNSLALGEVLTLDILNNDQVSTSSRRKPNLIGNLLDNQITGSACIFRRDLISTLLPFPEPTAYAYHDHWIGVCALTSKGIGWIDHPTQFYIQHSKNVIGEATHNSIFKRAQRLSARSGRTLRHQLTYIRDQRWAWRVNISRQLLQNQTGLVTTHRKLLTLFSRGSFTVSLFNAISRAVLQREAPLLRSLTLLLGSIMWKRTR